MPEDNLPESRDGFEERMRKLKELSARLSMQIERMGKGQTNFQSALEENQTNLLLQCMPDQQNEFHQRLLDKFDKLIKALKK